MLIVTLLDKYALKNARCLNELFMFCLHEFKCDINNCLQKQIHMCVYISIFFLLLSAKKIFFLFC